METQTEPAKEPHASLRLPFTERGSRTAVQAWQEAIERLKLDLPKAAFDTYVSQAVLVRFDPRGTVFTVAVRDDFVRDWLADRLTSTLQRYLQVIGSRPAEVRFIVRAV
jgi:chromosomal replication initiation ATPase DnaA